MAKMKSSNGFETASKLYTASIERKAQLIVVRNQQRFTLLKNGMNP